MRNNKILTLSLTALSLFAFSATTRAAEKDIVDTAVGAGKFSTLVKAVKAAGLVDALKAKGPITVFAPTDEAFAKIPEAKLKAILANKELLTAILKYHVVSGNVKASDVVKLNKADTLAGKALRINATGSGVRINGAKVIKADIECSNGVIHVIDTVLVPPMKKGAE